LEIVDTFEFPLNPISVFELSRGFKFSTVIGPLVFQIHVVGRILASLQVPVNSVSDLAATSVVLDPKNKSSHFLDEGMTNPDASTVGRELGDCGTDVQRVLQQHLFEILEALEAVGNNRIALAVVPADLG